jgi:hypothetical protein
MTEGVLAESEVLTAVPMKNAVLLVVTPCRSESVSARDSNSTTHRVQHCVTSDKPDGRGWDLTFSETQPHGTALPNVDGDTLKSLSPADAQLREKFATISTLTQGGTVEQTPQHFALLV